ncbi:MAG: type IV pilus assembly protein PilM [Candidatus Nealsonbacteria bacterium]
MLNIFQFLLPQKFIGIDVGTSYIKVVEVSRFGNRRKLENYGSLSAEVLYKKPFRTFDKNTLLLSSEDIARAIRAILQEAKIKSKQAIFSIPDFSTFFTNFELPQMSEEELVQAVKFEAKQHIPFPLSEMTLDWKIMEDKELIAQNKKMTVLLAAVPNEVINQYNEIAKLAGLELYSLEAEVFGLIRALVPEDNVIPQAIIDIGAQSTTCSIVDRKNLYTSHSFDVGGNELTNIISRSLSIGYKEAKEIKESRGLLGGKIENSDKELKSIISPLMDNIIREIEGIFHGFYIKKRREVKKVILAGGTALLFGLKEYFEENLKVEVEVANPFSNVFYPPILEDTLKEMGPSYSIAIGSALRGLEY